MRVQDEPEVGWDGQRQRWIYGVGFVCGAGLAAGLTTAYVQSLPALATAGVLLGGGFVGAAACAVGTSVRSVGRRLSALERDARHDS